ncbi:AAA family ATPase [Terrimonas alba]|uniref:AAA family ATPase n=1 Tax=Terrimonas alba TaxID=3349636 RepID=UPI0035F2F448
MIIMVLGLPGSGKSYFAARLAKMMGADYVNSDRLRKEMFQVRTYSEQEKAAVYNAMLGKMKEAVRQNRSLVLDATFHNDETRKPFIQEMKKKDRICFIEVTADENLIRQRLKKERTYSEADFEVYKLIRSQWEPLNEPRLLLKSTDENIDSMLQKAAEYLKQEDDKRANK